MPQMERDAGDGAADGTGSGPGTPEARMAFTPEALEAFGQGAGADALACNAFVAASLAAGDRLAGGDALLSAAGVWTTPMRTDGSAEVRVVGEYFANVDWAANDPDASGLTSDQHATRAFVLGLRGTLEDVASARGLPEGAIRDAGAWYVLPAAALVVVVGVVAAWIGDRSITTTAETRQLQLRLAAGADALAQRLGEQRRTGQAIAPSPIESAGLALAETRARSLWQEIAGGAGAGMGAGLLLLGAAGAAWWMFKKKKG